MSHICTLQTSLVIAAKHAFLPFCKQKKEDILVCCIIEIPKVADQKWRKLHLHFGESCKTL